MKRKFLIVLMAIVCVFCLAFAFAACDKTDANDNNSDNVVDGDNGNQDDIDYGNLIGHVWSEWDIAIPATCEAAGRKTRSCTNEWCIAIQVRSIDPLGHDWDEWGVSTEAGCETEGEETRICKNDSHHAETRKIDPLGHDIADELSNVFAHEGLCSRCRNRLSANHSFNTDNACTECDYKLIPSAGLKYSQVRNYGGPIEYSVEIGDFTGTDVIIPNYYNGYPVTLMDSFSFYDDDNIINVYIPESITEIGIFAFSSSDNLQSIFVSENNPNYASQDGIVYNKQKTEIISIPKAIKGVVTLSDNLTVIKNLAFYYCESLDGVIIPDSVAYIGDSAFHFCTSLKSVVMGNGVMEIDDDAFEGCFDLVQINLSNKLTKIGRNAFGRTKITSVVIPASVTYIGRNAFWLCNHLTKVTFQNPNGWWYSSSNSATTGTAIPASELSNSATAAEHMTNTLYSYGGYYLFRS